jgi:hypothetical protein
LAKEKEKIALEKEQNWLKQIPLKSMIDWGQQRHIWHINQLTLVKNPLDFLPKLMPLNHLRHFENSFY